MDNNFLLFLFFAICWLLGFLAGYYVRVAEDRRKEKLKREIREELAAEQKSNPDSE